MGLPSLYLTSGYGLHMWFLDDIMLFPYSVRKNDVDRAYYKKGLLWGRERSASWLKFTCYKDQHCRITKRPVYLFQDSARGCTNAVFSAWWQTVWLANFFAGRIDKTSCRIQWQQNNQIQSNRRQHDTSAGWCPAVNHFNPPRWVGLYRMTQWRGNLGGQGGQLPTQL